MRAIQTSPVREYRTPGSARGPPGNRRSCLNAVRHLLIAVTLAALASITRGDELSLRRELESQRAQYCYQFRSWSENPGTAQFTVKLFFVAMPARKGAYEAYAQGLPIPHHAEAVFEVHEKGKSRGRIVHLDAKRADQIACWIGYSGFFSADAVDPKHRFLDGKGLTGERIVDGKYSEKIRSFDEDLSCHWLYEQFQALEKNG